MSPGSLARCLVAWTAATIFACVVVNRRYALDADAAVPRAVVASVWSGGKLVDRAVLARAEDPAPRLDDALASHPSATLVHEAILAEGPVVAWSPAALAMSLVAGRDGLSATIGDRTAYVTPDDLLSEQAYDKGLSFPRLQLTTGVDVPIVLARLSERLGVSAAEILARARLRRVRMARSLPGAPAERTIAAETMTDEDLKRAAIEAGRYLARGVDGEGRFRYLVDAPTNRTLGGYDWPRHAGATYFVAQIAALSKQPDVAYAALRAAGQLRDHALVRCGEDRCVGDEPVVDLGSTSLAVLAFVEVARTGLDAGYAVLLPELTAFLRAQQRPDGEFMHEYDRAAGRRVDVQYLYYSGEAALALSRAHALLADPRDLDAAERALAHLVGPAWSFFGSRYYWGEEHWTCQAMDDLWDRAASRAALRFCLQWQAFGRKLQYGAGDTPFDAEGAYGVGPLPTPRLTPAGSRGEAGLATLDAARRDGVPQAELDALTGQMRRSLALLLRHQLLPGMSYLFADPLAVRGAIPGSEVDWQLRIDYAQHAGSAMVRWLALRPRSSGAESHE